MRVLRNLILLLGASASAYAADCIGRAGPAYKASDRVRPQTIEADFDGDAKTDIAVLVTRDGKQGIVICRSGAQTPQILGAGTAFNDMRDLDFTAWRVDPVKKSVARAARRPPTLIGDALCLEWESASALVYWNGKRFVWYQQGD